MQEPDISQSDAKQRLEAVRRLGVSVRSPLPVPPPESAVGPREADGVRLDAATAVQAAKLLGVRRERIEAVLSQRFQKCERKILRYDVRLLYAVKKGIALPDADPSLVAAAEAKLQLLAGTDPVDAPELPPVPYEEVRSLFREPTPILKKFATRLDAAEYLRAAAADRLVDLPDDMILGGFSYSDTACYERASPGERDIGIEYGLTLRCEVPAVSRRYSPQKRRRAIRESLFGLGDAVEPVFTADVVMTDAALKSDRISGDFRRQLEEHFHAQPAIAAWLAPYEEIWSRSRKSLRKLLPEITDKAMKTSGLRTFEAAAAAAVLFCDIDSLAAYLERGPQPSHPIRALTDAERRERQHALQCREADSRRSEAQELAEIEAEKIRQRHRYLARMGLAADCSPADLPNLYGADPEIWKRFCESRTPILPIGRKHGKTFAGIDMGALFGYEAEIDWSAPAKSVFMTDLGLRLPGSWLASKTALLMQVTVDVRTGELLRPDGFTTTPQELFAGIRPLGAKEDAESESEEDNDADKEADHDE